MDKAERLRLLSIFHYVLGGLLYCFGCIGFGFGVQMGLYIAFPPANLDISGFPLLTYMGWSFAGTLVSVVIGNLTVSSGRYIANRTHKTFSTVIAGINCLFMPLGTILGIFTIVTLNKKEVIDLYNKKQNPEGVSELA